MKDMEPIFIKLMLRCSDIKYNVN